MKRSLIFILCSLVFVGCAKQSTEQRTVPVGNKYATGFAINETDSGILVEVFQPYQRLCVKTPMRRLGTMSTVQVGFLYALDAMECLAAVCNPELIYTPVKGDEIDLGDSMKPSAERVLQGNLDILLAVNYGQYDNLEAARLERLGVPIIYINEWQESSPLARAEWIRVLGALTGRLPQADSIFNEVEMKYEKLTNLKSSISNDQSTKIMSGNNFRGSFSTFGNTTCRMPYARQSLERVGRLRTALQDRAKRADEHSHNIPRHFGGRHRHGGSVFEACNA